MPQQGGMPPQQQGMPQEQPAEAAAGAEDMEQASPEEQAQYEKLMENALSFIHGEQSDQLVERLAQGEPEEAIADVAVSLVIKLYESAEQAGQKLMDSVLMAGGEDIVNEVINLGVVAGVYDFEEAEGEAVQQEAWFIALDKFGRYINQTGQFDEQGLRQGAEEAMAGKYDNVDIGAL